MSLKRFIKYNITIQNLRHHEVNNIKVFHHIIFNKNFKFYTTNSEIEEESSIINNKVTHRFLEGDWNCVRCGFHNFKSRSHCHSCGYTKNSLEIKPVKKLLRGDWLCTNCNYHNFTYRSTCLKCSASITDDALERVKIKLEELGDWDCSNCKNWNFSFRDNCFRCKTPKPKKDIQTKDDNQKEIN